MVKSVLFTSALAAMSMSASAITIGDGQQMMETPKSAMFEMATMAAPKITAQTFAQNSRANLKMTFGYAGDLASAYAMNNQSAGNWVGQYIELPPETTTAFAGNEITGVNFYAPAWNGGGNNPVDSVTMVITTDPEGTEALVRKKAALPNTPYGAYTVELDEPLLIEEGQDLYIGNEITLNANSTSGYWYIPCDGDVENANEYAAWVSFMWGGERIFDNFNDPMGNLCISVNIEGENLPTNFAEATKANFPSVVATGVPFTVPVTVKNTAVNDIESIAVYTVVNGEEDMQTITLTNPIESMKSEVINVELVSNEDNLGATAKISIVMVNGEANNAENISVEGTFPSIPADLAYDRKVVVEEATGTWCGWCPLGYCFMEDIAELYPEDVIPIAVHGGDEMETATYDGWLGTFITGYPTAMINRETLIGFSGDREGNIDNFEGYYAQIKNSPAYVGVNLNVDKEGEDFIATATTTFGVSGEADFRIAYVVKENNVGPYTQHSYLPGYYAGFGAFSTSADVDTTFNDVARNINVWNGVQGSIPAAIEAGTEYTYSETLNISDVTGDKFDVVALVINGNTNIIENAAVVEVDKSSAIEANTIAAKATVRGSKGAIEIAGAYNDAAVYTIEGRRVATANGKQTINVASGLYIVSVDGVATKVLVK